MLHATNPSMHSVGDLDLLDQPRKFLLDPTGTMRMTGVSEVVGCVSKCKRQQNSRDPIVKQGQVLSSHSTVN